MLINAKIKTGQKKFRIEKNANSEKWTISVRSEPKDNKANLEIIKEMSKIYKNVRIIRGKTSKNKTILVEK